MATGYHPHEWACGDKITTTRLNDIEDGLAMSHPLYFEQQSTGTCGEHSYTEYDITYNDIRIYCSFGTPIVYYDGSTGITSTILCATTRHGPGDIYEATLGYLSGDQIEMVTLYCDTADGYMRVFICLLEVN